MVFVPEMPAVPAAVVLGPMGLQELVHGVRAALGATIQGMLILHDEMGFKGSAM